MKTFEQFCQAIVGATHPIRDIVDGLTDDELCELVETFAAYRVRLFKESLIEEINKK